jgi:hypothetical protein
MSHNPIRIAFHEWLNIVNDLRRARSRREVTGYLFGPPGWRTDGPRAIAAARSAAGVL